MKLYVVKIAFPAAAAVMSLPGEQADIFCVPRGDTPGIVLAHALGILLNIEAPWNDDDSDGTQTQKRC